MNRLSLFNTHPRYLDLASLLIRLAIAGLMLTHGWPKLNQLLAGGEIQFADPLGLGPGISLGLAVFAEFFCSILLALGLFTRLALLPLISTMLVAAFITHGGDPLGKKELALLYLLIYLLLLAVGPGRYSLDYLIRRQQTASHPKSRIQ
ncbi:MAG: DoxX family protein [Saprospiraceae bacterium]